ncbi:MAG: hypothetical protein J6N52_07295 [Clostridia bacterium]|nr:hypothetical protein [Clostridia bacterium]
MKKQTFKNSDELQGLIDNYFSGLEPEFMYDSNGEIITDKSGAPVMTERKPATISSMAYAVGLTSKEEFMELRKKRAYANIIARALLRVEAYTEIMLFDKSAASGAKFLLQSDFGWCEPPADAESSPGGVVILADIENKEEQ